jgi:hypothetical protein
VRNRRISASALGSEYEAAPVGHTDAHEPQPAHTLASIATEFPFGAIAPVGHTSRQRVHPVMEERECAQSDSSK